MKLFRRRLFDSVVRYTRIIGTGLLSLPFVGLVVTLIVLIVMWPVYVIGALLGLRRLKKDSPDVAFEEKGIILTYTSATPNKTILWEEVDSFQNRFDPPLVYPEVKLHSGDCYALHRANTEALEDQCKTRGIVYQKQPVRR